MKASSLLHATDQCECCFTFIPFPAIGTPPYILLPTYPLTLPTSSYLSTQAWRIRTWNISLPVFGTLLKKTMPWFCASAVRLKKGSSSSSTSNKDFSVRGGFGVAPPLLKLNCTSSAANTIKLFCVVVNWLVALCIVIETVWCVIWGSEWTCT